MVRLLPEAETPTVDVHTTAWPDGGGGGIGVGDGVGDGEGIGVGVGEGDGVGDGEGLGDGDGEGDGVGDGARLGATVPASRAPISQWPPATACPQFASSPASIRAEPAAGTNHGTGLAPLAAKPAEAGEKSALPALIR